MKTSIFEELKTFFADTRQWMELNVEYAKLTVAEKTSILVSALVAGAMCALMGGIVLVLFSMCLVCVFEEFLSPCLSYCCVAGIYLVLMAVLFLLRKQLIGNFISRFITKVLLDKQAKQK